MLDTGRWPFGLELITKALRTASDQRLLHLFVNVVSKNGSTFEQRLLGTSGIDTIDPVNLEAVLSKQFEGASFKAQDYAVSDVPTRFRSWRTTTRLLSIAG